jgi:NAD-dependent DNA ligase
VNSLRPHGLDEHGQPFNLRFNRARRAERDLCELLGLARGLLADGIVTASEASLLHDWVGRHHDALDHWVVRTVHDRLAAHFEDGTIDEAERADLKNLLEMLVSGELSAVCNTDVATSLPLDQPPPTIEWVDQTFVFTGKFAFGTRRDCERVVVERGGVCESNITKWTSFLVIGTFGSRDWVHTPFGRKIEKAVSYRDGGLPLRIVAEDHWANAF